MKRSRMSLIALGAVLAGFSPGPARALSLRNSAAELTVGLKPGGEARAGPLALTNTGMERVTLLHEVLPPTAGELKDGYDPLPDPGWIRLVKPPSGLDPGAEGRTEALIAPPKRKGLSKGLKPGWYQAQWVSEARTSGGLVLRLPAKLLLRVKPERGRLEERRRKARKREGLDFVLSPPQRRLKAALGRAGPAGTLKLANPNEAIVAFEAEAVEPAQAADAPQLEKGWEWAPNPDWLRAAAEYAEVAAGTVGGLGLTLEIPDQERYRGRKWAFLVEVRMLESQEEKTRRHLLLVETPERRP